MGARAQEKPLPPHTTPPRKVWGTAQQSRKARKFARDERQRDKLFADDVLKNYEDAEAEAKDAAFYCRDCGALIHPDNVIKHYQDQHPLPFTTDPDFYTLIPKPDSAELAQLEFNLKADGCRDALVIWEGENILVDGHNRLRICLQYGIEYRTVTRAFSSRDDVMLWMIQNQLGRRNLKAAICIEIARKFKKTVAEEAEKREKAGVANPVPNSAQGLLTGKGRTREKLAALMGIGKTQYGEGDYVYEHAPDYVVNAYRAGKLETNHAYRLAKTLRDKPEAVITVAERYADNNPEKVDTLARLYASAGKPGSNGTWHEIAANGGFHYGADMTSWLDFKDASITELNKALETIRQHHAREAVASKPDPETVVKVMRGGTVLEFTYTPGTGKWIDGNGEIVSHAWLDGAKAHLG